MIRMAWRSKEWTKEVPTPPRRRVDNCEMISRELEYFFAALRFFTRLPVPAWVGHASAQLQHATRYFPLVGVLVGAMGAFATLAAALVLPLSVAIILGMAATLLATGAFHEDGFCDACDGFGGGWDKAQVLAIMKDSRVGSYGAIGVALLLLAKWNALLEMDESYLLTGIVAGHAVSRFAAATLIFALSYVRDDPGLPTPQPPPQGGGDGGSAAPGADSGLLTGPALGRPGSGAWSKSKPLAQRMGAGSLVVAAVFGLAPCALLPLPEVAYALAAVALATFAAARYFVRRIGGYTGDCLGATQQVAELAFYLGLLCDFS